MATGEHRRSMNVITKQSVPVGKANRHLRGEVDEVLASLKALDLNILRWLLRYPFSRVEDVTKALVRVENPSRKHGREKPLDDATVYRHLEFHQELDLVESVIAPSLGKQRARLYHLSNLGLHVLAANMHPPRSASALARKCRTDEQGLLALLPRLASLVTLQDLINGIDTLAPRQLAVLGKPTRVWWSNVRDYRHSFFYRERPRVVAADAGVVLQVRPQLVEGVQAPDNWYCLFILLDNELTSVDLITNRLRNLIYYRECPDRWAGEQSYYEDFPPVLVLTKTKRRRQHWQRRAMQLSRGARMAELKGGIISQEEINTQENIHRFPWLLNWKALSQEDDTKEGTVPLKTLLDPIPQEAIPPSMILPHEWHHLDLEESVPISTAKQAERPLPQVIQGNFMKRAEHLRTRRVPIGNTQEHIALLGLSLTQRQYDILQLILNCPLVSTTDIAGLLGMEQTSVGRYIRDLRACGHLDLIDTHRYQQEIRRWAPKEIRENLVVQDDIGKRWQLSEQGMRVLAASMHCSIHTIAIEREEALRKRDLRENDGSAPANTPMAGDKEPVFIQRASIGLFALRRVEHQSGIYRFFADLRRATQEENKRLSQLDSPRRYALLWWEMGIFTERRYQHLDTMHNLRPDAAAEYQYQGKENKTLHFWLEWDRNTMGTTDLEEKFDAYLYYLGSREYQVRDKKRLPWILVVVPNPNQERRIAHIAAEKLANIQNLDLRLTTITRLEDKGVLGEIWLPVLPTPPTGLRGAHRCRFFEGVSQ